MTGRTAPHWDVAAYALGLLPRPEADRFEDHLAGCGRCADELEELLPTSMLLSEVDGPALLAVDQSRLDHRLMETIRLERQRTGRRRLLAAVAAVAVLGAASVGSMAAGAHWFGGPGPSVSATGPPTADPTAPGIGGPDLPAGEPFSGTDPSTGVRIDAFLRDQPWGTEISFALSGLTGPRSCALVVQATDGTREVLSSWIVPDAGYGASGQPAPLTLEAVTAMPRAQIARLLIQEIVSGGAGDILVDLPV